MKFSDEQVIDALFRYAGKVWDAAEALGMKRQSLDQRVNIMLAAGIEMPVKRRAPRNYTKERVDYLNDYIQERTR